MSSAHRPVSEVHRIAGRLGDAKKRGQDTTELEQELALARIRAYTRRIVDQAPPLSPERRAVLAGILRGGDA